MKMLSQSVKLEYWIKWIPSALSFFLLVLQVTDAENTTPEEKVSETGKIKVTKLTWLLPISFFIISCKLFFFFIGQKPSMWPANNCLQIMVCSYAMSSNCVWLQIVFCSCENKTHFYPSCDCSCMKIAHRFTSQIYSLKKTILVIKW